MADNNVPSFKVLNQVILMSCGYWFVEWMKCKASVVKDHCVNTILPLMI